MEIQNILWNIVKFGFFILIGILILWGYFWRVRNTDITYHDKYPQTLKLNSKAFDNYNMIPEKFSAEQGGISPPLTWSAVPKGAQSFALIITDPDLPSPKLKAVTFTHWILYNIPLDVRELPAGISNDELKRQKISIGDNGGGRKQFYPPCPILGTHEYFFRLYALDVKKIQPDTEKRKDILKAMEPHIIGYGELTGKYRCEKFSPIDALQNNINRILKGN
jgi:Raf kinase inhibitor-like YbhB/YbcL family protein